MEFSHIPVLLQPCLDGLNIDPAGIYLDGTAGGAIQIDTGRVDVQPHTLTVPQSRILTPNAL